MKLISSTIVLMMVGGMLSPAQALEVQLPTETASYKASTLPGYFLTLQRCLICHSAQYVATQPPGSSRAYWDTTVHKMQKVFGAPVKDEDIPIIVEYLVKTYGTGQ